MGVPNKSSHSSRALWKRRLSGAHEGSLNSVDRERWPNKTIEATRAPLSRLEYGISSQARLRASQSSFEIARDQIGGSEKVEVLMLNRIEPDGLLDVGNGREGLAAKDIDDAELV